MNPLNHIQALAYERPLGSVGYHRAAATIHETFIRAGLSVSEMHPPAPSWSCQSVQFRLNGVAYPARVNPFSPPCHIEAEVVPVGTLRQLEAADLTDKVALLYGALATGPVFPLNFEYYQPERDQAINRLLIDHAPAAIIALNPTPHHQQHIFEDWDMPIPSVTIEAEVGRLLLHAHPARIHLDIESQSTPSYVNTVVAHTERQAPTKLVICAHYDTKWGTRGAWDNASGVGVMLTLAHDLPQRFPALDFEFIAFGDEEYGAISDAVYRERSGPDLERILLLINIDGVGMVTGTNTVTLMAQSAALEDTVREVVAAYPALDFIEPWFESNHTAFAMHGIPAMAVGSTGTHVHHQAIDTLDWLSADKLAEVVALVTDVVGAVHEQPLAWTRPDMA